ncbi:hypothetical protein Tco_1480454 [Tanacetum coccineum]
MAGFYLNQPAISLSEEDDVSVSNSIDLVVSSLNNTGCDSSDPHDDNARVSASVLPVLGTICENLEECISVYRKYASETGFNVRLSCLK